MTEANGRQKISLRRRGGLFRKIAVSHAVVALVAAMLSGAVYLYFSTRFLAENAHRELSRTTRLAESLVRQDLARAALNSKLLSESFSVRSGIAARDKQPLQRQLERELKSVGTDFISVADADGVVVAHAQRPRADGLPPEPHIGEPLFLSRAFRLCVAESAVEAGVESIYPNSISVVAVAPVRGRAGRADGYLRLGYRLDDRFARNIRRFTGMEVAILHREGIIASTLKGLKDAESGDAALRMIRDRNLVTTRPIGVSGALLIVASPKSRIVRVQRQGAALVAAIMVAAFALASLLSLRLTARITGPLGELLAGVRRVEDGDLCNTIVQQSNDEVGDLAESFNRMTQALCRRDEELRRHQEQLIQSGKLAAIGELAAGVAHEVGNPLAALSGYLQLLRSLKPSDQTLHYVAAMEKEVDFIDAIIRELIEFARPGQPEHEIIDLNDTAEEALRILSFHKSAGNVEIRKSLSSGSARVMGSRKEILQAIINVALNAVQAMADTGGTLDLTVAADGLGVDKDCCGVIITDTGPGIPPDIAGRIFDPFFTTKPGGTGLGLAITYRIVECHSGRIDVVGAPGGGATVRMTFPAAATENTPPDTLENRNV